MVAQKVGTADGAIAVFVDEDNEQWRFSFIAIEYEFGEKGFEKQQTASKRYTYLFGKGAKTRTAQQRFELLNKQSTLEDLKTAFAVEGLSQEFYQKIFNGYKTKTPLFVVLVHKNCNCTISSTYFLSHHLTQSHSVSFEFGVGFNIYFKNG
jgi:CRISPR/Cas system endoribonuclease Cas6 (RAMP superfamily)